MKSSGIGGQAVMEGVMMKNGDKYAVAVRKPDQEIEVQVNEYVSLQKRYPVLRFPIIRGVAAFIESMIIGIKTLTYSSSFYEEEVQKEKTKKQEFVSNFLLIFTSVALAIGIFMIIPYFASRFLGKRIESQGVLNLIEGAIRIVLFVGYILAISLMQDIKRVFMYHGAEHKSINCIEHGLELTVENVRRSSKEHKRCGTSFMFLVMFISIIFFMFIRVESPVLRLVYRIVLVPVVAGVSYEFIKLAGSSDSLFVRIISRPGLWLQGLTTKEPDDQMIEVAIRSVEAVFDWREYLEENFSDAKTQKKHSEKTDAGSKNKKPVKNNRETVDFKDAELEELEEIIRNQEKKAEKNH
ncbi:MAG: DUF1385 domain-containing protein [Lachnospiraceae bacterium]|nr:DUF1385 domain-containing protein [Lachnospiraceae bacterium]